MAIERKSSSGVDAPTDALATRTRTILPPRRPAATEAPTCAFRASRPCHVRRKDDCAKEYKIGDVLGSGSFATVKRATDRKEGTDWAVKCIEKAKLEREDEEALKTEVAILEQVGANAWLSGRSGRCGELPPQCG